MPENVAQFIAIHNENINNSELLANFERLSTFAFQKNISLADLSIEKHRMPFINWCTGIGSTK